MHKVKAFWIANKICYHNIPKYWRLNYGLSKNPAVNKKNAS